MCDVACWNFDGIGSASSVPQRARPSRPSSGSGRCGGDGLHAGQRQQSRAQIAHERLPRLRRSGSREVRDEEREHAVRGRSPDSRAGARRSCGSSGPSRRAARTTARLRSPRRRCAAMRPTTDPPVRPARRSRSITSGRDARIAGTRPNTTADSSAGERRKRDDHRVDRHPIEARQILGPERQQEPHAEPREPQPGDCRRRRPAAGSR